MAAKMMAVVVRAALRMVFSAGSYTLGASIAPPKRRFPRSVQAHGLPKVEPREVGPERVEEHHLRIGTLPEHEIAGALLPGAAHEKVNIRQIRRVQRPLDALVRDAGRRQPAGRDLGRERAHGIRDLGPAAVVDAHREREHVVVRGQVAPRTAAP